MRARRTAPLGVWMNGDRVGTWTPGAPSAFTYAESWLASPHGRPLSLSLPLLPLNAAHRGRAVDAWFENLLPDSATIRERIRHRFAARSASAAHLLPFIGRDCVGAVQLLPDEEAPRDPRRIDASPLSASDVARVLRQTVTRTPFAIDDEAGFRISIAGAQEKTALLRLGDQWLLPRGTTPTTHILKLPLGLVGDSQSDLKDSVENEWLCLQLLGALGLPVAKAEIARFDDEKALVVRRFDRAIRHRPGPVGDVSPWIVRRPQEDLCQATGTSPNGKYETDGGPGIGRILPILTAGLEPQRDVLTFVKAQVAFWLLAAPDGHAKNFSIFLRRHGHELTPLYDVVSAWPVIGLGAGRVPYQHITLAMAVRGTRAHRHIDRIRVRHWRALTDACGVPNAFEHVRAMVADTDRALADVARRLPPDFPEHTWQSIADGVRRQRAVFLAQ
jgi:serine/threonine-protein kinase HipA